MSRKHELLPLAKAFVERSAKPVAKVDAGVLDAGRDAALVGLEPGGKPIGVGGDPRVLVVQAEAAQRKGDLDKASTLYSAALDKNPGDTEALNGLASIAQARGDLNGARASYKRVLSINPSYVPALVGAADVDWASGDRASAMRTYKEIVDRFPEGTYPARVKQRLESGAPPAPTPAPTPTTAPSATSAPAPAPTETGGAP
jgi:tetratricopeptide (TPR) repeat protein